MKVLLRTFGCRANHYDAEQVRAMLERSGASVLDAGDPDATGADVAVLTSCAVTSDAEADLRQAVRRLAKEEPQVRVIVTGCAAARSQEAIAALPNVHAVIPGADLAATAAAIGIRADAGAHAGVHAVATRHATARATLRVQEGCDEHCTFCATTLARGAHRSRPVSELVAEARALSAHHAEIVITGIHVGAWGKERGTTLGALLRVLVNSTEHVRFRLASVEATEVDPELAELLRDGGDRVCPYLHAPLQSGSDAVLRRMGRHWYTAATYARAIDGLVSGRAVFGLGADVMTGFPGETDANHEATLALVRDLPFTHLHVFPYSARPGTAAGRLSAPVPSAVARARAAALRALGAEKKASYAASRIGGAVDLVVLGAPVPAAIAPASRHSGAGGPPRLRKALSEDYLEVQVDTPLPRGARVRLRLAETMLPDLLPSALPPRS